jgi:hypothetical protein
MTEEMETVLVTRGQRGPVANVLKLSRGALKYRLGIAEGSSGISPAR